MIDTDTFIAAVGTVLLITGLLLTVAWLPWGIVGVLYRSNFVPRDLRRPVIYAALVLSLMDLACLLHLSPAEQLELVPPLANFVNGAISDPSLAALSDRGLLILRGIIFAECAVALLLPGLMATLFLAASLYDMVVAPPIRLAVRLFLHVRKLWTTRTRRHPDPLPYRELLRESVERAREQHEAELAAIDSLPIDVDARNVARNESERKLLRELRRLVSRDDQSPSPT